LLVPEPVEGEQKWEAQRANQKPGKAARLICLAKDINFIDVNRLESCKRSHLSYAMLAIVLLLDYCSNSLIIVFQGYSYEVDSTR